MPETEPINPSDAPESYIGEVNTFRRIKYELNCDDLTAAILTLAGSVSSVQVNVQDSEYNLDRVGRDIAHALEAVTKNGSINVSIGDGTAPAKPKLKVPKPVRLSKRK